MHYIIHEEIRLLHTHTRLFNLQLSTFVALTEHLNHEYNRMIINAPAR